MTHHEEERSEPEPQIAPSIPYLVAYCEHPDEDDPERWERFVELLDEFGIMEEPQPRTVEQMLKERARDN